MRKRDLLIIEKKLRKQLEQVTTYYIKGIITGGKCNEEERFAELIDQAAMSTEKDLSFKIQLRQARTIRAIEDALDRIATGEYGICETCEEPIAVNRLKAHPFATQCIQCRTRAEQATRYAWAG